MIAILIAQFFIFLICASLNAASLDGVILINNNATTTYSRTVEVLIPASDDNDVVDMCVGVGTDCTWESYSKTKQITLGETSAWYSVCAKVRDVAGNESVMKCVAIQYIN